jgi:plastocyanin
LRGVKDRLAVAIFAFVARPAFAANREVYMFNKGSEGTMVFEPALTNVAQAAAADAG